MRLDLATDLRARIGAPDKDARLTNAFVEVKSGPLAAKNSAYPAKKETCVRKRPGCVTTGYDYTTPIQGAGGSLPYLIYDDTFSAFDAVPAASSLIGDLVSGYYAMIDNPPTSPGPGDDYWSVTPPDSRRYRAYDPYQLLTLKLNSPDYWDARTDITYAFAVSNVVTTSAVAASRKACIRQAIDSLPTTCPGIRAEYRLDLNESYGYADWIKDIVYLPFAYRFDDTYVDENSIQLYYYNDTVNPGYVYDGYPITVCGVAAVAAMQKYDIQTTFYPSSPTAPAWGNCEDAVFSGMVFSIIRVA